MELTFKYLAKVTKEETDCILKDLTHSGTYQNIDQIVNGVFYAVADRLEYIEGYDIADENEYHEWYNEMWNSDKIQDILWGFRMKLIDLGFGSFY